jgi:hypothetical protein
MLGDHVAMSPAADAGADHGLRESKKAREIGKPLTPDQNANAGRDRQDRHHDADSLERKASQHDDAGDDQPDRQQEHAEIFCHRHRISKSE